MYVGKNPFCRPSVPLRGARRATAGRFSLNFAKFRENFPHVLLVGKGRRPFSTGCVGEGSKPSPISIRAVRRNLTPPPPFRKGGCRRNGGRFELLRRRFISLRRITSALNPPSSTPFSASFVSRTQGISCISSGRCGAQDWFASKSAHICDRSFGTHSIRPSARCLPR